MSTPPPYTWKKQGGYQSVTPPAPAPPPATMLFTPMPVCLVAPCFAIPIKAVPLKGLTVAGSETAAKGKEVVTTKSTVVKATTTVVSKESASAASKVPPTKPASSAAAKSTASKAPPTKPASSAPAKSTVSKKSGSATKSVSSAAKSEKATSVASSKKSNKSTESSKEAKVKATTKPDAPLPGMKYIYPKKSTCIHVICKVKVWESADKNFKCKTFHVGTTMTISELIEHMMGKEGDACKGWALTEVTEKGDGTFDKGTTVEFGNDKAGGTLAAVGWTDKNGGERPPVWLVLHKA